jgi:hypothetical protein
MRVEELQTFSRLQVRLSLTVALVLVVISSPIVMLGNPTLVAAQPSGAAADDYSAIAPSTIGQDGGDFTTQATLSSLTARPTNNIVNTNSFYDVVFLTATSGAIKTIQVTFPASTTIPSGAFFNEAEGVGPGTASKSGQTITYTVTNAVNVPAGTKIRLEFGNINNPLTPSANYKVTVTTRDASNAVIDGPTQSTTYTMKQLGTNAIANNHITTAKIADGAVTTPKIADGSITGEKIEGIDKIVFGTCTGTVPAMTAGQGSDAEGFSCQEPLAEVGDQVVGMVDDSEFGVPFPMLFNVQPLAGQVFFWFTSPYDDGTGTHTGVEVSYILFKKP